MSTPAVTSQELGLSVYGQVQYSYTVADTSGTVSGLDLGSAAALVGYNRAVGVESEITVLSAGVKKRSKALDDLNKAMTGINEAIANPSGKDDQATLVDFKKSTYLDIYNRYGVTLTDTDGKSLWESGDEKIKLGNLNQLQQNVKLVMDKEDNALQRVSSQLQSVMTKRDSSYTQMEKFLKKYDNTAGTIIKNIGK